MLQNIKVDIVYYKTATDFEMEFNLGGCCRMRMLTAKASDKKTAVQCLARAVSRSKVIMVIGPLFGEKGIINIVSSAIGSKTQILDTNSYKLNSDEEISIIEKSTPLITTEGYFGGCIIENGPQTMILLSDSKNIRKSIMKTLIHPYLEELYASEHTKNFSIEEAMAQPEDNESETHSDEENAETDSLEISDEQEQSENTEITPEEDVIEEISESDQIGEDETLLDDSELTSEPNPIITDDVDLILDGEEEISKDTTENDDSSNNLVLDFDDNSDEEETDLFTESDTLTKRRAKALNESYDNFEEEEEDSGFYTNEEGGKKSVSLDLPILIISVILLIVIALLCYFIFLVPTKYGVNAAEYISDIFGTLFK